MSLVFLTNTSISCNTNDEDVDALAKVVFLREIEGLWNVDTISGRIAGITENFNEGDIIWNFEQATRTLTIDVADGIEPPLVPGMFTYDILQSDGRSFLLINDLEQGQLLLSGSNLEIDQSSMSEGQFTDAFQINFSR